ncbi:URI1 [Branchiostoma lanceolatum]|uniref:Protein phosphatase 1 regulatory subunit 19 n=1 Tax=Branchiostoma lanceolatum TaxID=7740 RepID=A0A8K0F0Z1_BRALA|nr:URI1 [Branchiostoma lanceolatum]
MAEAGRPLQDEVVNLGRLRQAQDEAIEACKAKIKQWKKFKSDYNAVQDRLRTLPDRITYDIMVPYGSLAFMPGHLVHTNEVLVLLGDNWFVERSAKQSCEIIDRRRKRIDNTLKDLKKELGLLESRVGYTEELQDAAKASIVGQGEVMEIREEYVPERDDKPTKRISRVKKPSERAVKRPVVRKELTEDDVPVSLLSQHKPIQTEEAIWARLDTLERLEEEEDEMNRLWSSEEGEEDEEGYQEDDEDDGDDDSDINFTDDDIAAQIRKAEMSRRFEYDSAHRVAESEALQEKKKSVRWKDQQELGGGQESVKTDSTEEGLKAQRTSAIKPHDGKTVANIPYPKHVPYYEDDSDASTPARIVFHHTPLPVTEEDPVNESNVPSEGTVTSPADIYNLYRQPESPSLHTLPPGQVNSVPKVPPEEDKPTSGTKPKSILKKKLSREEVVEVVQNNVNREEAEPQKPPPLPAPKSAFSGEVLEKDVQPTVNSNTTSELPPKKVSRFKAARQKHR